MTRPGNPTPWWSKDRHLDRRPFLMARNRLVSTLRRRFETLDFIEVDTAALQISPGNEAHLHAFRTTLVEGNGETKTRYLHTSPEFACKKLLAAGERRIFTLAHVWRNRESGPLHSPEFTMLEWYRVGETYDVLMKDCIDFLRLSATELQTPALTWKGATCDPFAEPERLTLAQAFQRHADVDLMNADLGALSRAARRLGLHVAVDDTWSDVFSRILSGKIEKQLGFGRPTILCEYPASEAALARRKPSDRRVAERFELYVCGVELANCFGELIDPVEQRQRFEAEMLEMKRIYGTEHPIDQGFLDALGQCSETVSVMSGGALGFDRLVMLAAGATHIDQVIWTPVER